jgi:hypothetical protein
MKIRTITSLQAFDGLAGLWRDVVTASGQASPLLSHDWFASCWRTAGPNRLRELWVVEDSAGPLALVPVLATRMRYRGFPVRILQLMHRPEVAVADFPIARDHVGVTKAVLERLHAREDWDLFLLPGVPADSAMWNAFQSANGTRSAWLIADRVHVPVVRLTDRAGHAPAMLAALRRSVAATRARVLDTVVVEEHRTLDPRGALFEEVMSLSRAGSSYTASLPETTGDEVRRFFRELTIRASANGWLSLWVVRYEGRVVEVEYQLAADGYVHSLRRDTEQSPPELRLGDLLTMSILETLLSKRDAHTYYRYPQPGDPVTANGDGGESLFVELFAPRPYARLLHGLETRLLPLVRRLGRNDERPAA